MRGHAPLLGRITASVVLAIALAACRGADEATTDGARLFENHCVQCHGQGGRGSLGPDLRDVLVRSGWSGQDDETLIAARDALRDVILQGRMQRGRAPMPAFAGRFNDDEVEALLDHLVAIQRRS